MYEKTNDNGIGQVAILRCNKGYAYPGKSLNPNVYTCLCVYQNIPKNYFCRFGRFVLFITWIILMHDRLKHSSNLLLIRMKSP